MAIAAACANAGVVINGTRVIYPSDEREVTVKLTNEGSLPALVQAWLDDGDPRTLPQDTTVPFTLAPPLFRLDSKKGQTMRVVYTQEPLAQDKETLFWLNVLEVPPSSANTEKNMLQLAFRSRIKFFFRPAGLPGNAREAPAQVTWKFVSGHNGGYALQATNPTPYHVTFTNMTATVGSSKWMNQTGGMVNPGATAEFDVGNTPPLGAVPTEVDYGFIDDYGAGVSGKYRSHAEH
ncbi:molecular chaperone [Paraburkholderia phymatum]|uniref:Molecular chaperone n=1 Tax=Paraburkholderia phymatum TaxID=148447 RepID=A0ACC6UBD1_9BURK